MFNDTGAKLTLAAFIYLIAGILISLIFGLILLTESFAGVLFIILGSFSSWVTALIIHAVGEIVDGIKQSNINTYGIYRELQKKNTADDN